VIPAMKVDAPVPLGKQLDMLKKLKIPVALSVTFFIFISYSVDDTYITPFLSSVMQNNGGVVSAILFDMWIASLIGSKLGGFVADRIGTTSTLVGGMIIQFFSLARVSVASGSIIVTITFLMLWMITAWMFTPPQNFIIVSLAPEASGIMLSLNNSCVQLSFAAGAAIGGIAVGGLSIMVTTTFGNSKCKLLTISRAPLHFSLLRRIDHLEAHHSFIAFV
jgi:DHA1 family putative efflux transporter-like MFS transporter